MANSGLRGHHTKILEGILPPAQKSIALAVAHVLFVRVEFHGPGGAEHIHLNRMVDHQISGDLRVNFLRVAAEIFHRLTHGR